MKVKSKNYPSPEARENRKFMLALVRYFIWISLVFLFVFLGAIYRPH